MYRLLLLSIIAMLLVGCNPGEKVDSNISVWHDDERNVTCWIWYGAIDGASGISCLPDSQIAH
jgi:hypothetical protein